MAPIAINFGVALAALSGVLYFFSENFSPTIFIPAGFGVVLVILGVIGLNESARKHAMHAAAVVGLLGFVVPLGRFIFAATRDDFKFGVAAGGTLTMSILCAIFLGLCVKSFIDVRRARQQKEAEAPPV